jgi:hypothetical protein
MRLPDADRELHRRQITIWAAAGQCTSLIPLPSPNFIKETVSYHFPRSMLSFIIHGLWLPYHIDVDNGFGPQRNMEGIDALIEPAKTSWSPP